MVELKIQRGKRSEDLSMYLAKKSLTISSDNGIPVLKVTDEYGNSVRYEMSDSYILLCVMPVVLLSQWQ